MLSILCVRLTIKEKVGIPKSFKVGWYTPQKTGSSHLNQKDKKPHTARLDDTAIPHIKVKITEIPLEKMVNTAIPQAHLINVLENLNKILISFIRSQHTERDT